MGYETLTWENKRKILAELRDRLAEAYDSKILQGNLKKTELRKKWIRKVEGCINDLEYLSGWELTARTGLSISAAQNRIAQMGEIINL